ncbi:MAG: hydroxymethylglutaryl-CoA reductase, degradative [Bacteroidales bacterium]
MIEGFSKLSKFDRRKYLIEQHVLTPKQQELIAAFDITQQYQAALDSVAENTVANYYLPLGIVPNVYVNGRHYWVPMVIEESSVVAAASYAAKFWARLGGFHTQVISTTKVGQIHFFWAGKAAQIEPLWQNLQLQLLKISEYLSENMKKRGGGITGMEYNDLSYLIPNYHRIHVYFNTADAMGANYINSCLEAMAKELTSFIAAHFEHELAQCEVNMAILSNYTPQCRVECKVECRIEELEPVSGGLGADKFSDKFIKAVAIANVDPYRAVTHNKGIYNGIDAVVLATGNDFRAVEACGHAYAARNGQYSSLSQCVIENGFFRFSLSVPMAVGTVGGLTRAHPMAALALEILGNPSAEELMQIAVAMGMANHFAAIRALVTTGIQKGHMKMHLNKILQHLQASSQEYEEALKHFATHEVSYKAVADFLNERRIKKQGHD